MIHSVVVVPESTANVDTTYCYSIAEAFSCWARESEPEVDLNLASVNFEDIVENLKVHLPATELANYHCTWYLN